MMRSNQDWQLELGAYRKTPESIIFTVWAPYAESVEVKLIRGRHTELIAMSPDGNGTFGLETRHAREGDRYFYVINHERERPDPASRFQPLGIHGPSEIVARDFAWKDRAWRGLRLKDYIFYEMHTGTFTPEGTFGAAVKKIPYLKKLGITCVEIMPVGQFPGERNWGYDGVGLYAVQNSYGGPAQLKQFIQALHQAGIAVCLDVVYNHMGPEGNYLGEFGPYFTKKYRTPWGNAVNYDDRDSDKVRRFVTDNALYWVTEFRVDALRLDAIHSIFDSSAVHILQEMKDRIRHEAERLRRDIHLIAESDLNDTRIIRDRRMGGLGIDAQWSDDYHHAIHTVLTGEQNGYYQDYRGIADIAKAWKDGFVYDGRYSVFRRRHHGNSSKNISREKLVVAVQNHDQVGNRACGDRFSGLVDFETLKLLASLLLLSPYLPLLFMGEEYGEKNPFQYFIDHLDPKLVEAVRKGRNQEFASFKWKTAVPDPKGINTYQGSKLRWKSLKETRHARLFRLYQDLIGLRKRVLVPRRKESALKVEFGENPNWLSAVYSLKNRKRMGILFSFSQKPDVPRPPWRLILNTADRKYGGTAGTKTRWMSPRSAVMGYL